MLRGIAALMVAYNHAAYMAEVPREIGRSYLAVDFFFLLSGFVITAAFESKMPKLGAIGFLQARVMRLWPLMAIGAALSGVLYLSSGIDPLQAAIPIALAFVFMPMPSGVFHLNTAMWSIHFEIIANLLHFYIFRHLATTHLLFLSLVSLLIIFTVQGMRDFDLGQGARYPLGFARVILSYALGMALWRLNGSRKRGPAWAAFILFPASIIAVSGTAGMDHIVVLLVNPIVLLLGLGVAENGRLETVARFLGAWSFPLYAIHIPVQQIAMKAGCGWQLAFLWSAVISLLIGCAVDRRLPSAIAQMVPGAFSHASRA